MTDDEAATSPGGFSRRRFLKGLAGAAFVAPVVVSFTLDAGQSRADREATAYARNQYFGNQVSWTPNQYFANQSETFPNQSFPNQSFPNEYRPQHFPNQYSPNQPSLSL